MPNFSQSKLFNSEIFMKEFIDLQQDLQQLIVMMHKFADFDLEGKKIFVDQLEKMGEKMRIIQARIKLSDDELGNWLLRQQNIQMLNASTNWDLVLSGLGNELAEMRRMIEQEERTSDPNQLAMYQQAWRHKFASVPYLTPEDLENDPELLAGSMDPEAMKAVSEVLDNRSALEKYRNNRPLFKFLQRVLQGYL